MDDSTVAALVAAAAAGEQAAWDALVDRFTGLVWAVVRSYRLQSSDASDVFQTTWLRAVERLAALREPERIGGWLATTARREALLTLRRGKRERPTDDTSLDAADDAAPAPGEPLESEERAATLWRCFEQGSQRCQQLLRVLLADPPLPYIDVAAALGMPVGSIGPTRRRCLEQLRSYVLQAGVDADQS